MPCSQSALSERYLLLSRGPVSVFRQSWDTGNHVTHLVQDHPVGIDLGIPFRVQDHGLVGPEVGQGDLSILRADVDPIDDLVLVKVCLTEVSNAITCVG